MGLKFNTGLIIATLLRNAAGCDVNGLNVCESTANDVIKADTGTITAYKANVCFAMESFEECFISKGGDCDAATTLKYQQAIAQQKSFLYGQKGIECMSGAQAVTTVPLMSGDSGIVSSGSTGHTSSGSTYGWLVWQALLLVCCLLCCCLGAIGAAVYMAQQKKKKANKPRRQEPEYYPEPQQRPEEVPLASVDLGMDPNTGMEVIATGVDMNQDGIPDALQGDTNAPMMLTEEPMPVVNTMPMEAQSIFGPMPPLLPGAYSQAPVNYAQYPTTTYAQPSTATYAQPSYGNYAQSAYSAPMQSYAQPMNSYAGGVV